MKRYPYRESSKPQCLHKRRSVTTAILHNGEGSDEAAAEETCDACGSYRWQYCDGTRSDWWPPLKFLRDIRTGSKRKEGV